MPADAPSLRETIESAMAAPEPEVEAPAADAPVDAAPEVEPVEAAPAKTEGQPRRPDGKFDAKPKEAPEGAAKAKDPAPAKPPSEVQGKPAAAEGPPPPNTAAAGQPALRPPQSWKPQVRELAARLPAEFRPILEESIRRDNETNRVMQETAQARQIAQQTHQALQPYEGIARAAGMDAWTWAGQALQERAQLQMGSPAQRAPILARMLSEGGQGLIDQVVAILEGQPAAQHAPQQAMPDPRAIFREEMAAIQQQYRAEASKREALEFLSTQPEFVNDVLGDMNAIYAASQANGGNVTMKEAYDKACRMNEGVWNIIQGRKAVESAKAQASTVARSKVAASSIRGSPTTAPRGENKKTLREEIEEAVASSGRT